MKKIFFTVVFLATAFVQQSLAQDSTSQPQLSQLLHSYYDIKNALVAGNAVLASTSAEQFVKTANGIDSKAIPEGSITALVKDASHISGTKDIKHQREHFANFSTNMFALAKAVKLTSDPIYEAYCPMKKVNWLSSDKAIKNPYFGSSMLTCGKVVETINQ
jgi:hypothetical protein